MSYQELLYIYNIIIKYVSNSITNRGICSLRSHQWTPIFFVKCKVPTFELLNTEKEPLTYDSIVILFSFTPMNQLVILSSNILNLVEWIPFNNNSKLTANNLFFIKSSSSLSSSSSVNENEILDTGSYFILESYENYIMNKVY